jgi:hypothetical protein
MKSKVLCSKAWLRKVMGVLTLVPPNNLLDAHSMKSKVLCSKAWLRKVVGVLTLVPA